MYYKLKEKVQLINKSMPTDNVYNEEWRYVYDIRSWKKIYDWWIEYNIQYFILHDKDKLEVSDNMEFKSKPKTVFDLKYWDEIWSIDIDWEIVSIDYYKSNVYCNIFITKEEAEKELEKRKAIFNIKKYCYDNNIEIRNEFIYRKDNYNITYNYHGFDYNWCEEINELNLIWFFNNDLDTNKVIDNCKEDLNILFNIK